jgi:hypothetical protein
VEPSDGKVEQECAAGEVQALDSSLQRNYATDAVAAEEDRRLNDVIYEVIKLLSPSVHVVQDNRFNSDGLIAPAVPKQVNAIHLHQHEGESAAQ